MRFSVFYLQKHVLQLLLVQVVTVSFEIGLISQG
jgi:hypothetical protein